MTASEASRRIDRLLSAIGTLPKCGCAPLYVTNPDIKAMHVAAAVLSEQAARINPKPLTLEELYQIDNEPLYLFCTVGKWSVNGWHIVEPINYENASFKDLRLDHNDDTVISTFNYGNNYVAYRFPPKEDKPID